MKAIKRKRIREVFNTKRDQLHLTAISKAVLFHQWKEWRSKDVDPFDVLVNDLQDDDEAVEVLVQMLISLLDYSDVHAFLKHHFEATDRPNAVAFRNKILDQLAYKESELNRPFLVEDGYVVENLSYPHIVTKIGFLKTMVGEFDYDFSVHELGRIDFIYIPTERRNDIHSLLKLFIPQNMEQGLQSLMDNKFDKTKELNFSGACNLISSLFYHLTSLRLIIAPGDLTKDFLLDCCLFDGIRKDPMVKAVFKEGNEIRRGDLTKTGKPKTAKRLPLSDVKRKIQQLAPNNVAVVSALRNLFGNKQSQSK